MKQIWINRKYIFNIAITVIGGLYAFFGFIGTLVPLDEILSDTLNIWIRIGISLGVFLILLIVCFLIVGIILIKKKRYVVIDANSGHKLYLQYGDFLMLIQWQRGLWFHIFYG